MLYENLALSRIYFGKFKKKDTVGFWIQRSCEGYFYTTYAPGWYRRLDGTFFWS